MPLQTTTLLSLFITTIIASNGLFSCTPGAPCNAATEGVVCTNTTLLGNEYIYYSFASPPTHPTAYMIQIEGITYSVVLYVSSIHSYNAGATVVSYLIVNIGGTGPRYVYSANVTLWEDCLQEKVYDSSLQVVGVASGPSGATIPYALTVYFVLLGMFLYYIQF